jgi:hypothetical protein
MEPGNSKPTRQPGSNDKNLIILLVVLGLVFFLFVLFAGIAGFTP